MRALIALLGCGLSLAGLAGCGVTVQGEKRPLVRQQKIHGELETVVEHRIDKQESGANERESESTIFKERARVKTTGDIYHPDLFNYNIAVGGGLAQQHTDSDEFSGWSSDTLTDYLLSAEVLRTKPYSATLNASKSEDLIARQFLGPLRADRQSESVSVFLRSQSLPMMLQYSNSDTSQDDFTPLDTDFFSRTDERFRYQVSHDFSESSHMRFDYDRTDAHQETLGTAVDTLTDTYTFSHDYAFGGDDQHRLDSLLNYMDQTGSFEFENLRWQERLRLQHTPSLLTRYDALYADLTRETLTSKQFRGQAGAENKLFQSLVTSLDGFVSETDLAEQGNLSQYGGILALNYRKTNPLGLLLSTYTASFTHSDQSGASGKGTVVGESHTATDVVPVELDRPNVDVSTIRVRNASGGVLQEGDDYTVFQRNGKAFLTLIVIGGVFPPNFTEGQEFFVDYEFFIEPKRQEDTLRQNFTIRQRFGNGFSAFYAYRTQTEDVTSTETDLIPDEYTVHTVAADYTNGGLFLQAEYSVEDSTLIPLTSRKLDGRYRWMIGPATSVDVGATSQWLDFSEPDEREVTLWKGTTEVFSRLTDNHTISASADYRHEEDTRFGLTEGFQFDTELEYQYRQFSTTMGAELSLLERRDDRIESVFLYVRLQRHF